MDVVVQRYAKWWERRCSGLGKFPGKILQGRLVGLQAPRTIVEADDHASLLTDAVAEFHKERPTLIWPPKLIEELREWRRTFESRLSIQGMTVEEAVDAVLLSPLPVEKIVRLLRG